MITRQDCVRSINQLLCLILGSQKSRESNHLHNNPAERIEFCFKLIQNEIAVILEETPASELSQALYVPRMHLDSLNSLKTLNQLIEEVQW